MYAAATALPDLRYFDADIADAGLASITASSALTALAINR
ncbi:hypothetical protein ACZ87_01039, partial [Candidatus Erwinia dacicola]